MSNQDDFDDVPEARNAHFGALGGEGSAALEQTTTTVTPEGIKTHCSCGQCGRPSIVMIDWNEAIVGSQAALPEGWRVNQQQHAMAPYDNAGCSCGYWIELLFTPAELDRYVNTAVNQGLLNGPKVEQMKQTVRARMQQARPPQQQAPQFFRGR